MRITMTNKIIKVLKKAGAIKDRIEPICSKELNYPTKNKGYFMCLKCYPNQPERSKREDAHCAMRCSEHCGNTVRDK